MRSRLAAGFHLEACLMFLQVSLLLSAPSPLRGPCCGCFPFLLKRIRPGVLCIAAANDATSDQTRFQFHRQISRHIAWVTLPDGPKQELCCETTQQLKQHTRCFFLQLQHNGFNYSCLFCKTAAAQMTAGLIFRLLSAAALLLLALCTLISISRQAAILERSVMGCAEESQPCAAAFCPRSVSTRNGLGSTKLIRFCNQLLNGSGMATSDRAAPPRGR